MMKYQTFGIDGGECDDQNLPRGLLKTESGFSIWTAAIFITSLMAGMGVLALPHAMAGTGWMGLVVIALSSINSFYAALILGRCWILMEERWEEYREKFRYPYPAMGLRAVGPWMRYTVTISLHITLLGIATVYLLLCSHIAESLTKPVLHFSYKYWIFLLVAILCPLTWFGRLEEFRFAAIGALVTAALACACLFASILTEPFPSQAPPRQPPNFESFSLAFGTILFSFGGVFFFPTIQNDMADRYQFTKATGLGFCGLLLFYLPVTIGGYAVLGQNVSPNLLLSVSPGRLKTVIEVSLACHILLAFLLMVNPVALEIEETFGVKPSFNWKRCVVRTSITVLILIIAYTIPHFDKILNLIGGSTITLLTFIFPPLFYILLSEERKISIWEAVFLFQLMITGLAGGMTCTYFAVLDIFSVLLNKNSQTVVVTKYNLCHFLHSGTVVYRCVCKMTIVNLRKIFISIFNRGNVTE